ncbi:glycerophosphoryl diester phosphodiesterase [Phyllobacterium brassicacearum]|nr:glycerophosphoryl diester phosphodiesterase [Phyllobacterium brassicacearum]
MVHAIRQDFRFRRGWGKAVRATVANDFMGRFKWPESLSFPLTIGHRGASAHATENTLNAFSLASSLGAEMWELDTQLTKDGVCVVSHDDNLLRVFGIDARISALTASELAALPSAQVPAFSKVAALARNLDTGLYVELKAAGTGISAWRELEANDQSFAVLGSFNTSFVRELRDAGCPYPLSVLVPLGVDPHEAADAAGADIIHLCWERGGNRPQDLVTTELLERAKNAGRGIVLWHEERPTIIDDLIGLPVLGICSDRPELIRAAADKAAAA